MQAPLKHFNLLFLGLFLLFSERSLSFCETFFKKVGQVQVQKDSGDNNWCFVSIHPFDIGPDLVYRDYLITNQGLLMVFNSYSSEDNSSSTGAREYYFFPRTLQDLSVEANESDLIKSVKVTMSNGKQILFSSQNAEISDLESGLFKLDPQVNKHNKAGLEVIKYEGLWLDAGYALGHSPSENLNEMATFTDATGVRCLVQKSLIFNSHAEIVSDDLISKIVKRQCPKLKISF